MKKILTIGFLFLTLALHAERKVVGYYISQKGDTVKCTFIFSVGLINLVPDYISEQFKVTIITADNKERKLIPDTVKAFVIYDTKVRRFVSFRNNFDVPEKFLSSHKPFVFLEQLTDDYYKIYMYRFKDHVSGAGANGVNLNFSYSSSKKYLQEGNGSLFEVASKKSDFKDQMLLLFADNPELTYKINTKKYNVDSLESLIHEYSTWKKNGSIVPNDTAVHYIVDVQPLFEGKGDDHLNNYFKSQIKWPKNVDKNEKIIFQGIVEKDGTLSHIGMKGFTNKPELNEKFLEIAKNMTDWIPGQVKGLEVRSAIVFFIKYSSR